MSNEEFSNEFDTLLSSYKRLKRFDDREILDSLEFDEYEKSVYLTKAQEEIVIASYNGKNATGDSFENTEELRRYLANIVREAALTPITNQSGIPIGIGNSSFFTLPSDVWFITYEALTVTNSKCEEMAVLDVLPVTQDEYHKIKRNPFRGANERRALRLDLSDGNIEIVCKYDVASYYIRYLKKPRPIVLEDLHDGLTIDNTGTATTCELHSALHRRIVERAVMEAVQSKGIGARENTK